MKKLFAVTVALLVLVGCFSLTATAQTPESVEVYVTIANQGQLVVAQQAVTVTDADTDGVLTIGDALYAAHEAVYEGGAAAGYATANTQWGLSIARLWGNESGNYGYYVNNASAWSLVDPVKAGDLVTAFVYADGEFYSDMYTFFSVNTASAEAGEEIELTLSGAGYDAAWNPITVPVADATVTVNGERTRTKTDAEGKATVQLTEAGVYTISAVLDTQTLVPPVCVVTVSAPMTKTTQLTETTTSTTTVETTAATTIATTQATASEVSPETGDVSAALLYAVLMVALMAGFAAFVGLKKTSYEK